MREYSEITEEDRERTKRYNKRIENSKKAIDDMISSICEKINLQEEEIADDIYRKGLLNLEDGTMITYKDVVKDGEVKETHVQIISADKKSTWEINGAREQYQIFNREYGDKKEKTSWGLEVPETISDRSQQYNGTTIISLDGKKLMEVVQNEISGFGTVTSSVFSVDPKKYSMILEKGETVEYKGEYDWETLKRATYDIQGIEQMQQDACIFKESRLDDLNVALESIGEEVDRKSDREIDELLKTRKEILEACDPLLEEAHQVVNNTLEQIKEERSPIARCKKVISNIANQIKELFGKKETKQLPEGTENIKNTNGLKGLKVKLLSEMSNDEINKIMKDMRKDPWGPQQYQDEQILEEVFKRIGADDELAKMSAENDMVNKIWACHRIGKLKTLANGETVYNYEYTNEKGKYRTTIKCEDGVVTVDNKKYLDKEGNDVNIPEYYDYYIGEIDARLTNQVRISKNDFGGITLENDEKDDFYTLMSNDINGIYHSKIAYDGNNIEMIKEKQIFDGSTTCIAERDQENPFIFKDIYKCVNAYGDTMETVTYAQVDENRPDKLYSGSFLDDRIGSYDKNKLNKIAIKGLERTELKFLRERNPKAAKYFESLGKDEQEKEVSGEE